MASNTLTTCSPRRSRLRGSRATCCLLAAAAAVTAPLTAEAWVAPRTHAATRSSQQVAASTSGCLSRSSRSRDSHNRCQVQQRGSGDGRRGSEGVQLSGQRMGGSGRRGGVLRSQAVDEASASSTGVCARCREREGAFMTNRQRCPMSARQDNPIVAAANFAVLRGCFWRFSILLAAGYM